MKVKAVLPEKSVVGSSQAGECTEGGGASRLKVARISTDRVKAHQPPPSKEK